MRPTAPSDEATTRGWPASTSTAEHHHLLNEPIHVTTELTDPIRELGIASPATSTTIGDAK